MNEGKLSFDYLSATLHIRNGGPESVGKCPGVALADLGDVEGFDRRELVERFLAVGSGLQRQKGSPKRGMGC